MSRQSVRALERQSETAERVSRCSASTFPRSYSRVDPAAPVRRLVLRSLGEEGSFSERGLVHRSFSEGGFTIVEILTVTAIIAVLFGIVIGTAKYAQTKAARSRAEAEIATMETALERYKADYGDYPYSTENRGNAGTNSILLYVALATGARPYLTFKPNQVWDGAVHNVGSITVIIRCVAQTNIALTVTNVAVVDPFGNPYDYFHNPCGNGGQTNAATFDLWSYGPDSQSNNVDDITNWRQN